MPQSFRNRKYTGLVADIGKTALMTDSNVGGGDGGGKAAGQGEGTLQRMPRTQRGIGLLLKQLVHGSELHGYPIPRRPITFDLRQEPGAGKPHARICTGGEEQSSFLP